mmetsp:Transcript_19848/g.31615  ORF Transcript_19848/g.31615 Transcript_19848/m.31615 type:complete len:174 (+) Transcript_19848:110-631(+)
MAAEDSKEKEVVITDAEREEFRDAFKLFDKDGDGMVTVDEIYTVFQSLGFKKYNKDEVKKMVHAVDLDGNGTIDLDEFIALLRTKQSGKKHVPFEEELKQAFKVFDSDGNGSIDADELSKVMQALGEKLTKQDIEFMIRSVDIDGDQTIDFPEFRKMMQLAPIPQDTISKIKQ